jgi:hypothetical protein
VKVRGLTGIAGIHRNTGALDGIPGKARNNLMCPRCVKAVLSGKMTGSSNSKETLKHKRCDLNGAFMELKREGQGKPSVPERKDHLAMLPKQMDVADEALKAFSDNSDNEGIAKQHHG